MLREITSIAVWSYTAPFGCPVVPLVHTMHAASVGDSSGSDCGGAAPNA